MPAGTTSELYTDRDNPASVLEKPPAPPTDVPPPTKVTVTQPVATKARMADEKPDGTIRDTSTEALRPGNDLGFRNLDDEKPPVEKPAEKPPETKPVEPVKETAPVPEKLYAGKFKSAEELEKGYEEAQKLITKQGQEKSALERERLATPSQPVAKTPEQIAAEQTEANKIITEFVANPKEFLEKNVVQRTMTALTAQQIRNDWIKNNPDLAEHEIRVAFEATLLAQSDPEIAKDPARLLQTATDNFRQFTGRIRTEGAKEALTQETRTIPLLSPSSTPSATEQPQTKAPLTQDEAFALHLKMLKEQEQKSHRGLRR